MFNELDVLNWLDDIADFRSVALIFRQTRRRIRAPAHPTLAVNGVLDLLDGPGDYSRAGTDAFVVAVVYLVSLAVLSPKPT